MEGRDRRLDRPGGNTEVGRGHTVGDGPREAGRHGAKDEYATGPEYGQSVIGQPVRKDEVHEADRDEGHIGGRSTGLGRRGYWQYWAQSR